MKNPRKTPRKPMPLAVTFLLDILVLGIALCVFALFHHVLPQRMSSVGKTSSRFKTTEAASTTMPIETAVPDADSHEVAEEILEVILGVTADPSYEEESPEAPAEETKESPDASSEAVANITPEPVQLTPPPLTLPPATESSAMPAGTETSAMPTNAETSAMPTDAETSTPISSAPVVGDPTGVFKTKFADKFTDGKIVLDDHHYQSGTTNVTLTDYDTGSVVYHVLDIYISDISQLTAPLANSEYGRNLTDSTQNIAKSVNAICAINGDYYGARSGGVVIRDGVLYRDASRTKNDVCILYWDGTMKTFKAGTFDADAALNDGAYQAWNFGPSLLDLNGQPIEHFNSSVTPRNPRTAIGYIEPGHYLFVCVDGRSSESSGLTLKDLSTLMYELGCSVAYNLDGGQTSVMTFGDRIANDPYHGGRKTSDIIAITELAQ